jgi:hypothetical protein
MIRPAWDAIRDTAREATLHQLAPYVGKLRSDIAQQLVRETTREHDWIIDPFVGSGTIALEAALAGRNIAAGDVNPYARTLTRAKLFAPLSHKDAIRRAERIWDDASRIRHDLRRVPGWVRAFFHKETLRSALAVRDAAAARRDNFILACLLSILHHQRPGFLSYPSSHLVPYLRDRAFPRERFPELYEEREVLPRLLAKIARAYRRPVPRLNGRRRVFDCDAANFPRFAETGAIITSPPYMNELDYVRDNRLRLWFTTGGDLSLRDSQSGPRRVRFEHLMSVMTARLAPAVRRRGFFVIIAGDVTRGGLQADAADITRRVFEASNALRHFKLVAEIEDRIPDIRRSRRDYRGTKKETILMYQKQR